MGGALNTNALTNKGTQADDDDDLTFDLNDPGEFAKKFRESLPADQRDEFDKSFVPKSELTRMRQKDRGEIGTLTERLSRLEQTLTQGAGQSRNGNQQGSNDPAADAFAQTLEDSGIPNSGTTAALHEALTKAFSRGGAAIAQQAVQATIQQLAPFVQGVTNDHQERQIQNARTKLIDQLGKAVDQLWPDVESEVRKLLNNGQRVDPEIVLKNMFPKEYRELIYRAENRRRKQDNKRADSSAMEGMFRTRRDTAIPNAGGGETDQKPAGLDTDKICDEVMRSLKLR